MPSHTFGFNTNKKCTYHSLWFWWPLNQLSSSLFSLAGTNEVMRLIISRNLLQNSWHGWIDGEYFLLFTVCTCVGFNSYSYHAFCFIRHKAYFLGDIFFLQNKWIPIWYGMLLVCTQRHNTSSQVFLSQSCNTQLVSRSVKNQIWL